MSPLHALTPGKGGWAVGDCCWRVLSMAAVQSIKDCLGWAMSWSQWIVGIVGFLSDSRARGGGGRNLSLRH